MNFKSAIIFFTIISLVMPWLSFAQEQFEVEAPKTIKEAESFLTAILQKLPDAVKRIWEGEALPVWRKMWEIFLRSWNNTLGPVVEPWFNKEIEKRPPAVEEEFQKEKEEMQKDLWEKFKDLLK